VTAVSASEGKPRSRGTWRGNRAHQDLKEFKGSRVRLDLKAFQAHKVLKVYKVLRDPKESRDRRDPLALAVPKARRALKVRKDFLEKGYRPGSLYSDLHQPLRQGTPILGQQLFGLMIPGLQGKICPLQGLTLQQR